MTSRRTIMLLALLLLAPLGLSCRAGGGAETRRVSAATAERIRALQAEHDYFRLQRVLGESHPGDPAWLELVRAEVEHAFNELEASQLRVDRLIEDDAALSDSLRLVAHRLRYRNLFRLQRYPEALAAARTLARLPGLGRALREDLRNDERFLAAIHDVPPQGVARRSASELERDPAGRVPVTVNGSSRAYVLDTGANISTMMRSEAESLGLRIRAAGVVVGTSTDARVTADVAVAPRLGLGGIELTDVVFLVLPDEDLTFGDFRIPGIIGFPVIEAVGEVTFGDGGRLRIPEAPAPGQVRNLALRNLTPLVAVGVLGDTAICRLDTGADGTVFYSRFLHAHRDTLALLGRRDTVRFGGAGGVQGMPALVVPRLELTLGTAALVLDDVPVYTRPIGLEDWRFLSCNLGLDALASFGEVTLNLRSMSLLLR